MKGSKDIAQLAIAKDDYAAVVDTFFGSYTFTAVHLNAMMEKDEAGYYKVVGAAPLVSQK